MMSKDKAGLFAYEQEVCLRCSNPLSISFHKCGKQEGGGTQNLGKGQEMNFWWGSGKAGHYGGSVDQNNQESGRKYWAFR